MAIVVDKDKKREDIALSCKELILQEGIDKISVTKLAKVANIGKGTFYEYFKNKDELIFELVNILMKEHNKKKETKLKECKSARGKIKIFYEFFYAQEDIELRALYKEFLSISLIKPSKKMVEFKSECFYFYYKWIEEIIDRAIKKGELKPIAKRLIRGMYAMGEGMFIEYMTTNIVSDLKYEINSCVDDIFNLIEVDR